MKSCHRRQVLRLAPAFLLGGVLSRGCHDNSTVADVRQGDLALTVLTLPAQEGAPRRLLVVLHGWGGNAGEMAGLIPALNLPNCQALIPNAPFAKPGTANGRMWYDFPRNYTFRGEDDLRQQSDLRTSRQLLNQWLRSLPQKTGIPFSRTILAGFSQGGAMALEVGLSLPLAGLVILSSYLHRTLPIPKQVPPILMVHGTLDDVVPVEVARRSRDRLLAAKARVEYHELSIGHTVDAAGLELVRKFTLQKTGEDPRTVV